MDDLPALSETRQIHAGARPDPATGARATPLYQSTSFTLTDARHATSTFWARPRIRTAGGLLGRSGTS
ncbi:hypothetical protein CFP71_02845 [Amycolatopsis thailandensis]|uniref:Cystathionine gamma-synthase n=1 Tax=Amycolatopsis thailandensis TaxID=589330 RepID=A0A229SI21_9PSEU|nr:hypothetical protein CFP71_02845 [Amycolatopsis thailandensis]